MKNLFKNHRFLAGLLSVVVSVFLVSIVTYAATTIGTSIDTGGTVTMESASTTNDFWLGNVIADDDDSLFFDASGTQWLMWDDDPGEFDFNDDVNIAGTASSTSATTTDYLYVGEDITELAGWDFSGGDLIVSGAAHFAAKATSTTAFAVGSGTINNPDMTGGDLYVQGDAEIDAGLWVDSATTTDSLAIGGYASSTGNINTQANIHVGGDIDIDGIATSSSYISLPFIKLVPSATPSPLVAGQCFIDSTDYQLNCTDGTNWFYAY